MDAHFVLADSYARSNRNDLAFSALPDAPVLPYVQPRRRLRSIGWRARRGCDAMIARTTPCAASMPGSAISRTSPSRMACMSTAARLRPRMGMVGDIWLAFIGPEVRRGASGLGGTPRDALKDFNQHFMEPLISRNGSEPHDTD